MTTGQLIVLDHVVAVLTAAAWLGAGSAAAARRCTVALALLGAAVLVTLGRAISVAVLADRGWWFVQEKVLLGLPMLAVASVAAVVVAGPRLVRVARGAGAVPPSAVVWLLTCGYAALAGFVVTFVAGYPLTWSAALIAIGAVAGASLLTGRVLRPEPAAPGRVTGGLVLSRRSFVGVAAAGAGLAGGGLAFVRAPAADAGGGAQSAHSAGHGVAVTSLRGPAAPGPGGTVRQHTLTARTATVSLASGRQVQAWTYDGQLPGAPITALHGDLVEVTLRNDDIDDGVTLHWHGYDVPCGEDGAPGATQDAVMPGEEFVYRFAAEQVGTYWYHTHQVSHRGVRLGLYGTLVVSPRDEPPADLDLTLPVHTFDGVRAIGDQDGVVEHTAEPGTSVRLRLVNTDSDPRRFALDGTAFMLAAVDGRDLNEPGEVDGRALRLPAGGRYDLTFTMPDGAVVLVVDGDVGVRLGPGEAGPSDDVPVTGGWPELDLLAYGRPSTVPFDLDSRFDRHFTLVLDRGIAMVDGRPAYAQLVNGRGHPSIPQQLVAEGDLVRFTVVNRSLETHPWHLHGHSILVLSRDGRPATGSPLWVDTFDVRPGEVWEVGFEATNPGVWMNHCHNLPHAEQGMMLRLGYDGVTSEFDHDH